jgi:hypothetical protein
MNKDNVQFCLQCGASAESLKYQMPPHSAQSDAKFCKECGAIIGKADRKTTSYMEGTTKDS